jgi:hypothetical protein
MYFIVLLVCFYSLNYFKHVVEITNTDGRFQATSSCLPQGLQSFIQPFLEKLLSDLLLIKISKKLKWNVSFFYLRFAEQLKHRLCFNFASTFPNVFIIGLPPGRGGYKHGAWKNQTVTYYFPLLHLSNWLSEGFLYVLVNKYMIRKF